MVFLQQSTFVLFAMSSDTSQLRKNVVFFSYFLCNLYNYVFYHPARHVTKQRKRRRGEGPFTHLEKNAFQIANVRESPGTYLRPTRARKGWNKKRHSLKTKLASRPSIQRTPVLCQQASIQRICVTTCPSKVKKIPTPKGGKERKYP